MNLGRETETLEFKKSTGELKEGIISIGAILNKHQKGELYFGVRPDGTPIGQEISEKTLRDISQAISNHIEPQIFPEIQTVRIDGKECILVRFEGYNTPYFAYDVARIRVADEICSAHAAHHLGNDRYLGVVLDDGEIGYKFIAVRQRGKVAQVEDVLYLNRLANGLCDLVGVHVKHLIYARADGAVSHDCYFNHMLISFHQLN